MASRPRRFPRAAGFTLVEVLTTVSLFGVIGAVAVTNYRAQIPAFRVRGAALLVAGDMNQARLAAIKESRIYQLLPLGGTGYQIRRDDRAGGMEVVKQVDIASEFTGVTFGRTGIDTDPYGNDVAAAVPAAAIVFHSNGTVQGPAAFFVEEATSGDERAQSGVTLTSAGRIRVWRYQGEHWS